MRYCCVPGCLGRGGYKFPPQKVLRAKWISAVRRQNLVITPHTAVCSAHFTPLDFKNDRTFNGQVRKYKRLLESAVPSVFSWSVPSNPAVVARRARAMRRLSSASASVNTSEQQPLDIAQPLDTSVDQMPDLTPAYVTEVFTDEYAQSCACVQTDSVDTTGVSVQTDVPFMSDMQVYPHLSVENLENDMQLFHYYTGLENLDKFRTIYHTLGPAVDQLTYYRTANVENLSPLNQFLLMVAKLRQDLDYLPLSRLAGVSVYAAENVFVTWVNFCSRQWSEVNLWPAKDLIQYYAPADFKRKFPSTRVIVDGTEIPIQKPSNPLTQRATFSSYKNRNTVKTLIGSSPGGLISYISPAYGGSVSDRQIIERSGLPTACDAHDSVMADKGFNVQDLFAPHDVQVNIPTFFVKKNRLSARQVIHDRKIASKRVHIERIIGLMKTYKILTSALTATETRLASHIIKVCGMLCNFRNRIVSTSA